MKIIKSFVTYISILFITLLIISCENEPLDPAIDVSGNSAVVGTYFMTAFNSSTPTDLNQDGTSSTNQLNETNCFDGSYIVMNSDNTFVANSKGIDIDVQGTTSTIACYEDEEVSGTWSVTGNQLSLTFIEQNTSYTEVFVFENNTIKLVVEDGELVGTDPNGTPVFLTSNLEIIYTK